MKQNSKENVTKDLVKIGRPVTDVLNLDLNDMDKSIQVLTEIVKTKKFKEIPTVAEAIAYYVKSKELGLPFLSSLDHMFDVSGKTNIDVHLMRALVLRAGSVHWEEVHSYQPLYKYIDKTGYIVVTGFDDTVLPYGFEVVNEKTEEAIKAKMGELEKVNITPVFKMVDRVTYGYDPSSTPQKPVPLTRINYGTKYKFERIIKTIDGNFRTIIEYGEFTFRDAVQAGLLYKQGGTVLNDKSPWLLYLRNMLEHRSWTFGCRKIADDITFGLLERTEYLDMNHLDYTIEEGKAVVVGSESSDK